MGLIKEEPGQWSPENKSLLTRDFSRQVWEILTSIFHFGKVSWKLEKFPSIDVEQIVIKKVANFENLEYIRDV